MSTDPALLVAVAGGFASLGTALYLNRRKINEVRGWAWGRERDETDAGVAGDHRSLNEQIESIEGKLDTELEERREDHREVEKQVVENRRYIADAIANLTETLNDQLPDADVDVDEDVEPDWIHDGDAGVDPDASSFFDSDSRVDD